MFNKFIPLTNFGLIKISGPDTEKFLQGQLTCDVRDASQQKNCLGAHCDHKGRVQFNFRLLYFAENFYFHLPHELIPNALALLQKYAVFSKVKLEDVSDQWISYGIYGAKALDSLTELDLLTKSDQDFLQSNEILTKDNMFICKIEPSRFLLIFNKTNTGTYTPEFFSQTFTQENFNLWKFLDIQAGIANVVSATAGQFTPHDLNYHLINAVSFNKGCYTGQEIIARMQYLGKLKSRLHRINLVTPLEQKPGTILYDKDHAKVGTLVDSAQYLNNHQGLAVIQDSALDKEIFLEDGTHKITLTQETL